MQYNNFITGIRGIAVIAVVFFHAGYGLFNGGFIGVDVFFVLSGFLIMSSISHSVDTENFSFRSFYLKRFLRIFPAALSVLFAATLLGYWMLLPVEMDDLLEGTLSFLTMSSNMLASRSIDYFDIGVEYKPLVHYWSLAIELQFYAMFPIISYSLLKYKNINTLIVLLISIFVSSLLYATWYESVSVNASYFSTLTRVWEFSLGALSFLFMKYFLCKFQIKKIHKEIIASFSLLVLLSSIYFFDESYYVPGIVTIIPNLSVAVLLAIASDSLILGKFLSWGPLRFIGTISFSLYLVHQPIFAFYRTFNDKNFTLQESIFLIALSLSAAYILWQLIEKRFQTNNIRIFFRAKSYLLGLISLFLLTVSTVGKSYLPPLNEKSLEFYQFRYDNNPRLKECRVEAKRIVNLAQNCIYNTTSSDGVKHAVLWGDSHMNQISLPLANKLNQYGYKVTEFSVAGCPPIIGIETKNKDRLCKKNSNLIHGAILEDQSVSDIVLFAYWVLYIDNDSLVGPNNSNIENYDNDVILLMQDTIEPFINAKKNVHIIYPIPVMDVNIPLHKARMAKMNRMNGSDNILSNKKFVDQSYRSHRVLDSVSNKYKLNKINLSSFLKNKNGDYMSGEKDVIYYRDDNHLSLSGGNFVSQDVVSAIVKYGHK